MRTDVMEMINLTIDGKPVRAAKDTTILKAARTVGVDIPTLCYFELRDLAIENK
jgi:NADP-reducing hydrogenase subunit HndD